MSCEIHDDSWYCYKHEGEWFHIKGQRFPLMDDAPRDAVINPVELKFPDKGDPKSGHPKDELDSKIEFKTPESYDGYKRGFNPFGKIWDILNGEG